MVLVFTLRSGAPSPLFRLIDGHRAGIRLTHPIPNARIAGIQFLLNGWGVAARDLNEDGWPDLVLGGGPGWGGVHLSDGGPWRFTNATASLSLAFRGSTIAGIVVSDLDHDGHLDLVTSTYDSGVLVHYGTGPDGLRRGEVVHLPSSGTYLGGMAAADIDRDGNVDIVAMGYRQNRSRMQGSLRAEGGADRRLINSSPAQNPAYDSDRFRVSSTGLVAEMGAASVVLFNRGDGRLVPRDLSSIADYGPPADKSRALEWSLSCAFQDVNGDGLPDLYVCNDYHSPDRLWINSGNGRFVDKIGAYIPYTSLFSMGVAFTDLDRDGIPDWIVMDMLPKSPVQRILEYDDTYLNERPSELFGPLRQVSRNTLFVSARQRGSWNEVGCLKGLAASGWSWGPVWVDLDGDGLTDLLVPSGYAQNLQDQSKPKGLGSTDFYPTRENGVFAFLQTTDGRFEERSDALGLGQARSVTMAVIPCDMDHDGDPDIIVHNFSEPLQLFENRTERRHVCVSLSAPVGGQSLEGTTVRWKKGTRTVDSTWFGGGTYLSSPPPEFYAALEDGAAEVHAEVVWPDGRSEEHKLRPGWHRILAPVARSSGGGGPLPSASRVDNHRGQNSYSVVQEFVLPGTNGDHHDDLPMQDYLPVSLSRRPFIHKTEAGTVWLSDTGGGSLVQMVPTDAAMTNWAARVVQKRMNPPPACFLPDPSLAWLENTYRYGASSAAGLRRLGSDSRLQSIGSIQETGLAWVAGPDAGPWILGGSGRFGQFPEHPRPLVWDPVKGISKNLFALPFDGATSDGAWIPADAPSQGNWWVAEWFGEIWRTDDLSSPWVRIPETRIRSKVGHLQTALFPGTGVPGSSRPELIAGGLGLNNEWVFRAEDRLGWLLVKSSAESPFAGLVESMTDSDGVAQRLIPFKHFKGNPDMEPVSNVVDYSLAQGPRIHKRIAESKRVDMANSMVRKDSSGRWERSRLPLKLQVAPIRDAVVIGTSSGPAWLISFNESDGHRVFGGPPQRWPAVVFWPDKTDDGGRVSLASELGFSDLVGDTQFILVGDQPGRSRVLAIWKDDRRCRIYALRDP